MKIHNLNLKSVVETEFGKSMRELMEQLYLKEERGITEITSIIASQLKKYDYEFNRESTVKDWIINSGIKYSKYRKRYKVYNSEETILLSGSIKTNFEKLLKEHTDEEPRVFLTRLHTNENLNTNEIAEKVSRLFGFYIFGEVGENQEVRRLFKRYKIKLRKFEPKEADRERYREGGKIGLGKSWQNPDFVERHKQRSSKRMRESNLENWNDPEKRIEKEKLVKDGQKKWLDNGGRLEMSERAKIQWKDPAFREKMLSALPNRKDNKLELEVKRLLEELALTDYEFNPYLKFPCGNFCFPDFKFGNKIIEVHGDFWHANPELYSVENLTKIQVNNVERDIKKDKLYTKYGFECLVIWEQTVKENPDLVKRSIATFLNK